MGSLWVPGFEVIDVDAHGYAGRPFSGGPYKVVWHTVEGSLASAITSVIARPGISYHFGISWKKKRRVQFIRLDKAARAVLNKPGGADTNGDGAIQIVLEGFANESKDWPDEAWQFIGESLGMIHEAMDGHFLLQWGPKPLVDASDGFVARPDAPQRYTAAEYDALDKMCGHGNVPENDHYDPGKLGGKNGQDQIVYYAGLYRQINPVPEGDMPVKQIAWTHVGSKWAQRVGLNPAGSHAVMLYESGIVTHIEDPKTVETMKALGVKDIGKLDDTIFLSYTFATEKIS